MTTQQVTRVSDQDHCNGIAARPKFRSLIQLSLRFLAALVGLGLLGYLVFRTGPGIIWRQVQTVGWGLALIIILGGFAQFIKTCAWRQAFRGDISRLSWSRSFGVQVASDAAGQLGLAGKLLGEGIRISLVGSVVPLPGAISACAIDGGLHTLTAAGVTVSGIAATLLIAPLSGVWRVYASVVSGVLVAVVILASVAVANRWRLMGNTARAIGRLPRLQDWVGDKQSIIDSAEYNLLTFHHEAPAAFWASLSLNLLWHGLAILEVFLILMFMGAKDRRGRSVCVRRPDKGRSTSWARLIQVTSGPMKVGICSSQRCSVWRALLD